MFCMCISIFLARAVLHALHLHFYALYVRFCMLNTSTMFVFTVLTKLEKKFVNFKVLRVMWVPHDQFSLAGHFDASLVKITVQYTKPDGMRENLMKRLVFLVRVISTTFFSSFAIVEECGRRIPFWNLLCSPTCTIFVWRPCPISVPPWVTNTDPSP